MSEISGGEPQYWVASMPLGTGDGLAEYLAQGQWVSPSKSNHSNLLAIMSPGDLIALKSITKPKSGLPFFNADIPVSAMTIHATGSVTSLDATTGTVNVNWEPSKKARVYYFWIYLKALSRIDIKAEDGGEWARRNLINFCFDGADQDIDRYLCEPWATSVFPPRPGFTWIPFYEDFATRLLEYRDNRAALVEMLLEVAETEPLLDYVRVDRFADGTSGPVIDIDPFTFLSSFNRGITVENRKSIAEVLGNALGVDASVPDDFDGIPVLNNQRSQFTWDSKDRTDGDIDALWRVLAAGISLADDITPTSRGEFIAAYDAAQDVRGVKWNITQGLYWVRPNDFMTLDMMSRQYLSGHYGLAEPTDGASYLALLDEVRDRMRASDTSLTSFPLISYTAWFSGNETRVPHTIEGMAAWAGRMAESIDLDEVEHDYKRNTANLLAQSRQLASAGDLAWVDTFRKAMNSTNTLDFRFKDDLRKAVAADPARVLAVFNIVWDSPEPASLDEFQAALHEVLGKLTPGNATGLGAALLMAVEPEANAPYGTSRVAKWYQLTGFRGKSGSSSASTRYADLLSFLDAFALKLSNVLRFTPTRLEAQGIAWATTENEIPGDWDEADAKALQAWRAQASDNRRAWLIRAKPLAVGAWISGDFTSLTAKYLGDVPPGAQLKEVKNAVEVGYEHQDYTQRKALTEEYYAFLTKMKPGDVVVTQADTSLHMGVLDGPVHYEESDGDRLRRDVSWRATEDLETLAETLRGLLDKQGKVVDITDGVGSLMQLMEDGVIVPPPTPPPGGGPNSGSVEPRDADEVPPLPEVTPQLAAVLHMERSWLQEIVDLLGARQQVVFYGPPGTGKTYLAMKLARHLVGPTDSSRVQLVQFHPSYAYEDFFEGYRPTETEQGQATFELKPGPLRRIAAEAKANTGSVYVLVIDELNRANLAKVFGELYFLLEYRLESIQLQYQPTEAFQLPRNLFFIGTMNTADRSIALLDTAMRRRFSFVELHPDEPPVRDVLSRWLAANEHDDQRAELLTALNAAIEEQDRDLQIGPSYLMRPEAATDEGLARVWKYDIMPLLEEHYYGRLTRDQIHQRFGLDTVQATVSGEESAEATAATDLFDEPDPNHS